MKQVYPFDFDRHIKDMEIAKVSSLLGGYVGVVSLQGDAFGPPIG